MTVLKMIYRAGFTNPWHPHPCAHDIYVLDNTLRSHQGTHGPGTFVWFPGRDHGARRYRGRGLALIDGRDVTGISAFS